MIGTHKYARFSRVTIFPLLCLLYATPIFAQTLPDIPDLIRVTVDHADDGVLIQWEASTDPDIEFYHLYKRNPDFSYTKLFSFSANTFEYKHLKSGLKNLAYSLVAQDSAGNRNEFENNVHRAARVSATFDPCKPANNITWTPYEGWGGNISGYKLYGGPSGGPLQLLRLFVDTTINSYVHEAIIPGLYYSYYVEVLNLNGITSLSAIDSVASIYPEAPDYITIDYVSVIDRSSVELEFSADVSGPINDFRIMKRSNSGTPFTEVLTIMDAPQSTQTIQDEILTIGNSYEYIVQSIYQPPACETPIVISSSNPGNNVLLEYGLTDQIVTLNWSPYETYINGLSEYTIQRRSGSGEFVDIATVGSGITSWSEAVESAINGFQSGELQYKVLAISNAGGPGEPGISISNVVSVTVETHLKVPSAFTPGSNDMNFEFKPMIDFAPRDYTMIILDRGGRKLFETRDPGEGWDGRFRAGNFVNEGVYVYFIQYTDYTGIFKSFTGNVTVLYP